jgi:hypothetical protein
MAEQAEVEVSTEVKTEVQPDYEVEARKYGWVPKEEFRGDTSEWRDAPEFVKRGQEILGFVRKENGKLKDKLAATEATLESFKKEVDEFKDYSEKARAQAETNAYNRALAELKEQKKKAIELGDGATVVEIEDEIEKVHQERTTLTTKTKTPEADPIRIQNQGILNAWIGDGNEIFAKDAEVMQLANEYADVVRLDPKTKHLTGTEYLEAVADKVREAVPHKFNNAARTRAAAVGSSSDAGRTTSKKKSYADLPDDAKKACDKFVKNGWLTKEKYVEDYFQGE